MTTLDLIRSFDPCLEARDWSKLHPDPEEAWASCTRPDWLVWIASRRATLPKETWVRVAVACARSVLHLVPAGEDLPLLAVEAAEAWLADPCDRTRAAATDAANAAYAVAYAAAYAAYSASDAAYSASDAAAYAAYAASSACAAAVDDNALCDQIRSLIPLSAVIAKQENV